MSIARARPAAAQLRRLALLVGFNLALAIFGGIGANSPRAEIWVYVLQACVIVLTVSQVMLVGLWLAWGDLFAWYRWAVVVGSIGIIFLAGQIYVAATEYGPRDAFAEAGLPVVAFLLAVHAALLPLRWLGGWRLRFGDGWPPPGRRGQFTLQHWFVWCACLVLPLMLLSFHHAPDRSDAIGLGAALVFTMPLLAAALRAAFSRRWWLWSLLAIAGTVSIGGAIFQLHWNYMCSLGQGFAIMKTRLLLLWVAFPTGLATALVANLLLLRAVGMRWVNVADARGMASEPQPSASD